MKIFDVTIDLETCSLAPNAAVLQVAAVAWQRNALASEDLFFTDVPPFDAKVDLRSCVMDGFDFDRDTCRWWSQQPEQLRQEIAGGDCYPVNEVFDNFIQWLTEVKTAHKADTLCIWSQGADDDTTSRCPHPTATSATHVPSSQKWDPASSYPTRPRDWQTIIKYMNHYRRSQRRRTCITHSLMPDVPHGRSGI